MFSLPALLIVSVTTFIIGGLLSLLLSRSLSPGEHKIRSLETRLQQKEEELLHYQQEVTEHFAETAQRVDNFTRHYKDIHEHLANSALKLANVDISRQLLSANPTDDDTEFTVNSDFEPPKDWAPGEGTLREDYGLAKSEISSDNLQPATQEAPPR